MLLPIEETSTSVSVARMGLPLAADRSLIWASMMANTRSMPMDTPTAGTSCGGAGRLRSGVGECAQVGQSVAPSLAWCDQGRGGDRVGRSVCDTSLAWCDRGGGSHAPTWLVMPLPPPAR